MSKNVQLLVWKDPNDEITVLDGNDDGRELIESIGSPSFADFPSDHGMYSEHVPSGLWVIEAEYEDDDFEELSDHRHRRPNEKEFNRLVLGQDPLMNV